MALFDGLINLVTGMGVSGRDKSVALEFASRIISETELEAMFRDDWIAKKIVKIPAYDMVRNWRQWMADDADIEALEEWESALDIAGKLQKALVWARLYGGAALIIDDGGSPSQEIRPESFAQGRLKQIQVASRKRLKIPDGLESNPRSAYFGQPKVYRTQFPGSPQIDIHPSRVIPIFGELAPDTDDVEDFWGDSILRACYDAVSHAAKSAHGFAQLIDEAKVDIVSVSNLASKLSTEASSTQTINRWRLFGQNKSLNGVGLTDKDTEEYTQKQISFDGHDRLIMAFLLIVCGAADVPATRMLGQSPNGLNATGESDLTNYYNAIEGRQRSDLGQVMQRLDAFLLAHVFGKKPDGIWYEWRPLWTPTPTVKADLAKKYAEVAQIYSNSAIVNREALQAGVESLLVNEGTFPGFEKAIETAEKQKPDEDEILPGDEEDEPEQASATDAAPRPLYVSRPVKNAAEIIRWARAQGFKTTAPESELHVTVAYSRSPVDWLKIDEDWQPEVKIEGGARIVEPLGDKGAIVLLFKSNSLEWRWRRFIEAGASWDYEEYQPHITITYDGGEIDLEKVEPYHGEILLGPERFETIVESWQERISE